jgi:glycosyltransferase involved in cell wall biosynthesis
MRWSLPLKSFALSLRCMPQPLKVLISAYACEPGKGSEPEVGWNWALQMSRFHDVTVLTRKNNRAGIERALAELPAETARPGFVYHDLGPFFLKLKKSFGGLAPYYVLWQCAARRLIRGLHKQAGFGLLHHVTFAGYRYPVATGGQGVPSIWGPVGGIRSFPSELMPWSEGSSLFREALRNADNFVQGSPLHRLRKRALAHSLVLASTREMQSEFQKIGVSPRLMPTIGLDTAAFTRRPGKQPHKPLRFLFVGQVITLKGADLAIDALAASGTDATLTFIGSGNYSDRANVQADALGLRERVHFTGRLPRDQVLKQYADHDVFLFPSVHDTGSFAVIEAMVNELPVICLDIGGPPVAVGPGCGIKVEPNSRNRVVSDLGQAIRHYCSNPQAVLGDGAKARMEVLQRYDWNRKGEEMNKCYLDALAAGATDGD